MGQQEIIKVLRKKSKMMSSDDIAKATGRTRSTVNAALIRLLKQKEVVRFSKKKKIQSYQGNPHSYLWRLI